MGPLTSYGVDQLRRLWPIRKGDAASIAVYERELPVSLERMFENALDVDHLPWLHTSSFSDITVIERGNWGWEAIAHTPPRSRLTKMHLRLTLDREQGCWTTETLDGLGKGAKIVTHATQIEPRKIKIRVEFSLPSFPAVLKGAYATRFLQTYAQLYDEDLSMMSGRQSALDQRKQAKRGAKQSELDLGPASSLKARLPFLFELGGESYRLDRVNDQWCVFSALCPHALGPLDTAEINADGLIQCPWHGYQFNVLNGECITESACRLPAPPEVSIQPDSGHVIVQSNR